jgi:hypothetical protein
MHCQGVPKIGVMHLGVLSDYQLTQSSTSSCHSLVTKPQLSSWTPPNHTTRSKSPPHLTATSRKAASFSTFLQ